MSFDFIILYRTYVAYILIHPVLFWLYFGGGCYGVDGIGDKTSTECVLVREFFGKTRHTSRHFAITLNGYTEKQKMKNS